MVEYSRFRYCRYQPGLLSLIDLKSRVLKIQPWCRLRGSGFLFCEKNNYSTPQVFYFSTPFLQIILPKCICGLLVCSIRSRTLVFCGCGAQQGMPIPLYQLWNCHDSQLQNSKGCGKWNVPTGTREFAFVWLYLASFTVLL